LAALLNPSRFWQGKHHHQAVRTGESTAPEVLLLLLLLELLLLGPGQITSSNCCRCRGYATSAGLKMLAGR